MTTTMAGNRLYDVRVSGNHLTANLVGAVTKASFSASMSQVTEMGLTFQDSMDLTLWRSGILGSGAAVHYGGWSLTARTMQVKNGSAGPELTIKAPSAYVEALRGQTGAKSWGTVDVASWVNGIARGVGMSPLVQPGVGKATIVRTAPTSGQKAQTTWDVLVAVAKERGCWVFEYGNRLVFARPSWLIRTTWARRYWPIYCDNYTSYSAGLTGMPEYSVDPNSNPAERLTFETLTVDGDLIRPGDEVDYGGHAAVHAAGKWVVTDVSFPLTAGAAVKVQCVRPVDPAIPPPKQAAKSRAKGLGSLPSSDHATYGGISEAAGPARDGGAVSRWEQSVIGRYIDMDGMYGAQCVDLADHYSLYCVGRSLSMGNGKDIFGGINSGYTQVAASSPAMRGDIACYDGSWGGGYGHVCVVLEDRGSTILTVTQNYGPPHEQVFNKGGLMGYLRPKAWNPNPQRAEGTGGKQQYAQV